MFKSIKLVNTIYVSISMVFSLNTTEKGLCSRFPLGCCPHTRWDSYIEICVDCSAGYYWINCSKMCEYPTFGKKCSQQCGCEKQLCNFELGCPETIQQNSTLSDVQRKSSEDYERNFTLPVSQGELLKGTGQNTTQCHISIPYEGKRNMIFISLIVVTLVLAIICIAYFMLLGFEKYLMNTHREEQIYVNQIITA